MCLASCKHLQRQCRRRTPTKKKSKCVNPNASPHLWKLLKSVRPEKPVRRSPESKVGPPICLLHSCLGSPAVRSRAPTPKQTPLLTIEPARHRMAGVGSTQVMRAWCPHCRGARNRRLRRMWVNGACVCVRVCVCVSMCAWVGMRVGLRACV